MYGRSFVHICIGFFSTSAGLEALRDERVGDTLGELGFWAFSGKFFEKVETDASSF